MNDEAATLVEEQRASPENPIAAESAAAVFAQQGRCRTGSLTSKSSSRTGSRCGSRGGSRCGSRGVRRGSSQRGLPHPLCADAPHDLERPSTTEGAPRPVANGCQEAEQAERPRTVPDTSEVLQTGGIADWGDLFHSARKSHDKVVSSVPILPSCAESEDTSLVLRVAENAFPEAPKEDSRPKFAELSGAHYKEELHPKEVTVPLEEQQPDQSGCSSEDLSQPDDEYMECELRKDDRRCAIFDRRKSVSDMPGVPLLCGLCPPAPANLRTASFPSRQLHNQLRESLDKCKEFVESTPYNKPKDLLSDLDAVGSPVVTQERSVFSQKPHHRLNMWSCDKVFALDASMLQCKVKHPWLQEAVQITMDTANISSDAVAEMRQELERTTVRMIASKPFEKRSLEENVQMLQFMSKFIFFKDLDMNTVAEIMVAISLRRFDAESLIYEQGDEVEGVYLLLRGAIEESTSSKRSIPVDENRPRRSVRRAQSFRLSSKGGKDAGAPVLGMWDVFEMSAAVPTLKPEPRYSRSCAAAEEAEGIFVPLTHITRVLEAQKLSEKLEALQGFFPDAVGREKKFLMNLSSIRNNGSRLQVHELFEIRRLKGGYRFHEADCEASEEAMLTLVLDGSVQLTDPGGYMKLASQGSVFGEEALVRSVYKQTAVAQAPGVTVLQISVSNYLQEFPHGKLKMSSQMKQRRNNEVEEQDAGKDETVDVVKKKIRGPGNVSRSRRGARPRRYKSSAQDTVAGGVKEEQAASAIPVSALDAAIIRHHIATDRDALLDAEWKFLTAKKVSGCVAPPLPRSHRHLTDGRYEPMTPMQKTVKQVKAVPSFEMGSRRLRPACRVWSAASSAQSTTATWSMGMSQMSSTQGSSWHAVEMHGDESSCRTSRPNTVANGQIHRQSHADHTSPLAGLQSNEPSIHLPQIPASCKSTVIRRPRGKPIDGVLSARKSDDEGDMPVNREGPFELPEFIASLPPASDFSTNSRCMSLHTIVQ